MALLRLAGSTTQLPGALARRRALSSAAGWRSPSCMQGPSICAFTTATSGVGSSSSSKSRGNGNSKKNVAEVRSSAAAPLSLEPRYVGDFRFLSPSFFPYRFAIFPVRPLTRIDGSPQLRHHRPHLQSQKTTCIRLRLPSSRRYGTPASPTASSTWALTTPVSWKPWSRGKEMQRASSLASSLVPMRYSHLPGSSLSPIANTY